MKELLPAFFVFCDGGARGNPGPAAIGFLVKNSQGKVLVQKGKFIGRATNNVAEYTAVIEALRWLSNQQSTINNQQLTINFFLDSQLVVNQLNGLYKIKNANLRALIIKVRQQEKLIPNKIYYRFIPRAKNRLADALVKQILKKFSARESSPQPFHV